MPTIELSRLATGEPAHKIGVIVHALISKEDQLFAWSALAYSREASELKARDFTGSFSERVRSVEDFVAKITELQHHHDQKIGLGRKSESCKTSTPWGQADHVERFVKGINSYSTPSHGGFKVSVTLNDKIPAILRNENGWYEEDREAAKVAFALPQFFTDFEKKHAGSTMVHFYPKEYEALTGKIIPEGQSMTKDRELFEQRNVENWVAIAAIRLDEPEGMTKVTATKGGKRSEFNKPRVEEKDFLVPSAEYNTNRTFDFVIDPDLHSEYTAPSLRM
jgi:hypothetical protein